MSVTTDRPSAAELRELSGLLNAAALDRKALAEALGRIEEGLRDRGHELDESGGLLDEGDRARRMSLAREDDRLREQIAVLHRDVREIRERADEVDEAEMRRRVAGLLAGLRGHSDAEASLVLENADTEVGSGD